MFGVTVTSNFQSRAKYIIKEQWFSLLISEGKCIICGYYGIKNKAGSGCETCMPTVLDGIGGRAVAPFRVFLRGREVHQNTRPSCCSDSSLCTYRHIQYTH